MTTALDTLLNGIAARREDTTAAARQDYAALVVRLADGKRAKADTPAAVEDLLERAKVGDDRLRRDVARVVAHRAAAAKASLLPALEAALDEASDACAAAHELMESETARLRAAWLEASDQVTLRGKDVGAARDALEQVAKLAPAELAESYQRAHNNLQAARQAVALARLPGAAKQPLPGVWREPLARVEDDSETSLGALRRAHRDLGKAERALRRFDTTPNDPGAVLAEGTTDGKLQTMGPGEEEKASRAALVAELKAARVAYGEALLAAADAVEDELPVLERDLIAATKALLAADPVVKVKAQP